MEGVNISWRAARILNKDQGRDLLLAPAPRADAGFGGRQEGALPGITLVLLTFAGWCQHLYTCIDEGRWGFLLVGSIVSPIGIMHGWGVWFGWW